MDGFRKKIKAFTLFETLIVVILLTLIVFMGMNLFGKVNSWYINYLTNKKEQIEKSTLYVQAKWDIQMANEIRQLPKGFSLLQYSEKSIRYENNKGSITRIGLNNESNFSIQGSFFMREQKVIYLNENQEIIFVIEIPFQVVVE